MDQVTLYTIGHSTRELSELVGLLHAHEITLLMDVRTLPRSRHNPQFNRDRLEVDLPLVGVAYRHFPELGGLRKPQKEIDRNSGWRNASFRGYADYMLTTEFDDALGLLLAWGKEQTAAVMCAESVPWRCHRSLIADALVVRGAVVFHILDTARTQPHHMTPFADVHNGLVTYPAAQLGLLVEDSLHD